MGKKKGKKATCTWNEKYTFVRELGEGGNAKVYLIRDTEQHEYALKELVNRSEENKTRFRDEIGFMTSAADISGVMPVIEFSADECWYVMPVAQPIMKRIQEEEEKNRLAEIKEAILQLSDTLRQLSTKEIAHRDIKPANLYYLNGRYCFGDFGLVDFPEKEGNVTKTTRNLGAKFTMAPEMMRNPKEANGLKADIYSFAKTIWMLLSGKELGFDGPYNYLAPDITLRSIAWLKNEYLVDLELLLVQATDHDPGQRPTASEFYEKLSRWVEIAEDDQLSQENEWAFLNRILFGDKVPRSASWDDNGIILDILNIMTSLPVFNHMLFSNSGGMDFVKAEAATEKGWIDLITDFGFIYRVKPEQLYLENFYDASEWNYIQLKFKEADHIFPSDEAGEFLTEDIPGHYVDASDYIYGVYDYDSGEPLPKSARQIYRYTYGATLFVMKAGYYNAIRATYDGRHGDCSNAKFREYIEALIQIARTAEKAGINPESILNSSPLSQNPFKVDDRESEISEHMEEWQKKENYRKYVRANIASWEFQVDGTSADLSESKVCFYFTLARRTWISSSPTGNQTRFLTKSMKISSTPDEDDGLFLVSDRNCAKKILAELENAVVNRCRENRIELPKYIPETFDIELIRGNVPPSHLFSENEIRGLMRSADDRRDNTLVIDEDGYAHIIARKENPMLYPVRHESWDARKNYVGRYSELSDSHGAYFRVLNGWLRYLMTGEKCYADVDDFNRVDDSTLIREIRQYM